METSNDKLSLTQMETCAVITMRDTIALIAQVKKYLTKKPCFCLAVPVFMMHFSILIPESGKKVRSTSSIFLNDSQIMQLHKGMLAMESLSVITAKI